MTTQTHKDPDPPKKRCKQGNANCLLLPAEPDQGRGLSSPSLSAVLSSLAVTGHHMTASRKRQWVKWVKARDNTESASSSYGNKYF